MVRWSLTCLFETLATDASNFILSFFLHSKPTRQSSIPVVLALIGDAFDLDILTPETTRVMSRLISDLGPGLGLLTTQVTGA